MSRLLMTALLALSPAVVAAQSADLADWGYESLRDDLRISDLLGLDVMSRTDHPVGRIRNVMLDKEGNFEAATIEFNHAEGSGFALALMEWSDIDIEPRQETVTASLGISALPAGEERAASVAGEGASVRDLIGMPVEMSGQRFGKISDLLFAPDELGPTAVLVESENGTVYALPPSVDWSGQLEKTVSYDFPVQAVRELGEFESQRDQPDGASAK